ncbi:MAG: chloride channel protein [Planctomycetes bacterium]|nr:chloride channel protein [Planctomycetota bacterium]
MALEGTGLRRRIANLFSFSADGLSIVLALIVGSLVALCALAFSWLTFVINNFFYSDYADSILGAISIGDAPSSLVIGICLVTGAILTYIATQFSPETKGHGIPNVLRAVITDGGKIKPRVAVVKTIASAFTIGAGGSAGSEGPIVQIGSAIGSAGGMLAGFKYDRIRILVGCGAAAGISATFNAPIAGAFFSAEIIMKDIHLRSLSPIICASVAANVVSSKLRGNEPAFHLPENYKLVDFAIEIPLIVVLGVLCGLAAAFFIFAMHKGEDFFGRLKIHGVAKILVGVALLLVVAYILPGVLGSGYGHLTYPGWHEAPPGTGAGPIDDILGAKTVGDLSALNYSLIALVGLVFAKAIATSLTLGSGGSGGVFAPALFIGAATGGAFNVAVVSAVPSLGGGSIAGPAAYALLGMGATVAAATHAPLSAIIILWEMSKDNELIVPSMAACVVATMIARRINPLSIYLDALSQKGVRIGHGFDLSALEEVRVEQVMARDFYSLELGADVRDSLLLLRESELEDFPVTSGEEFVGMVFVADLRNELQSAGDSTDPILVDSLVQSNAPVAHRDDNLAEALAKLVRSDVKTLAVVDSARGKRIIGVLTDAALLRYYQREASFLVPEDQRKSTRVAPVQKSK